MTQDIKPDIKHCREMVKSLHRTGNLHFGEMALLQHLINFIEKLEERIRALENGKTPC